MLILWWSLIIVNLICLVILTVSGFFARYYPIYYLNSRHPRYRKHFRPVIDVFIPCKGLAALHHLPAFLRISCPEITVHFIVESHQDPVYPHMVKLFTGKPGFTLTVAGQTRSCCQKNHNLLKGIEAAGQKAGIYIFLDADIHMSVKQLRRLIQPLSNPSVTMTSGFQWNILKNGTLSERFLAYLIGYQHMAMCNPLMNNIWGGAYAIRRHDFEELKVADCWAGSAVDDMSLKKLIWKKKRKAVFVPYSINEVPREADSLEKTVRWFERQVHFLKYYVTDGWLGIILLFFTTTLNYTVLAVSTPVMIVTGSQTAWLFSLTAFLYSLGVLGFAASIKRPAADQNSLASWVLLSPFFNILATVSVFLSIKNNYIQWGGITYHMGSKGSIRRIVRS